MQDKIVFDPKNLEALKSTILNAPWHVVFMLPPTDEVLTFIRYVMQAKKDSTTPRCSSRECLMWYLVPPDIGDDQRKAVESIFGHRCINYDPAKPDGVSGELREENCLHIVLETQEVQQAA